LTLHPEFDDVDPMAKILEFPTKPNAAQTEIVRQARFLLDAVGPEGLKLTSHGYLPKSLTKEFWNRFVRPYDPEFEPKREVDSIELYRLNFLLTEGGYLRRRDGRLHLTKKGAAPDSQIIYQDLADAMLFEYNWAFDDRFEEHPEFQMSALEFLEWIAEGGDRPVTPRELFDAHYDSYLLRKETFKDERKRFMAEEPVHCLQVRLFDRFAVPFGLLEGPDARGHYRPTELLRGSFFDLIEANI
jgi:hypothetical protein